MSAAQIKVNPSIQTAKNDKLPASMLKNGRLSRLCASLRGQPEEIQ